MKDHKRKSLYFQFPVLDGSFSEFTGWAAEVAATVEQAGMKDPMVEVDPFDHELEVSGWVPMTDAEKRRAAERRKKEREAKKAKADREKKDRYELFLKLQEEFSGSGGEA